MVLGLFGGDSSGGGFDRLSFNCIEDNETIFTEDYTSPILADDLFEGGLFDLGSIAQGSASGQQDVKFVMTVVGEVGEGFSGSLIFGNATSVPEPDLVVPLVVSGSGLAYRRRTRRSK